MPRRKITMLAVAAATAAITIAGCSNTKSTSSATWAKQNNQTTFSKQTATHRTTAQTEQFRADAAMNYVCFPKSRVFYEPQARTWFWSENGSWFESKNMPQVASLRWERPVIVSCDTVPFTPGCTGARPQITMSANNTPTKTNLAMSMRRGAGKNMTPTAPEADNSFATVDSGNGFID